MFTGLVEGLGVVSDIRSEGAAVRLAIDVPDEFSAPVKQLIGASVAINGCCLTVVDVIGTQWAFEAGAETLSRTNLGRLKPGDHVNLERSLPVDGRLGGHFVQGHVDGTGEVAAIERDGEWTTMWFHIPAQLAAQMVPKGSVAVDGASLTVVEVEDESTGRASGTQDSRFSVALIPHTLAETTLGEREVGDAVNIETDILGKYVARLIRKNEG